MAEIGVPAAIRPIIGTMTAGWSSASRVGPSGRTRPRLPGMTLGENFCNLGVATVADSGSRKTSIARARLAQPANEAALLERHDEPMNSGFRAQLQRFFHFVERRGHPRLLQALVDETQQLALLFREHLGLQSTAPIRRRSTVGRITILAKTNREQTLVVHALFGKRNLRDLAVEDEKPTPLQSRWTARAPVHAGPEWRFQRARVSFKTYGVFLRASQNE